MKYKHLVYTPIILIITNLQLTPATTPGEIISNPNYEFQPENIIQNQTLERFPEDEEEHFGRSSPSFSTDISKCLQGHEQQITENVIQGKNVILKCFKAALMLQMFKYLGESKSIKLFNGLLEFKKIPEKDSSECGDESCEYNRNFGSFNKKKDEYVRMYKKAMQKLIDERIRLNSYRNQTEEEKAKQLNRINENSQAFLSEVIRNLGNEDVEKAEEEKLKKEITDPKLLSVLDTLTKDYMLRFRFYPGVSARMMRSNGGFTFDVEVQDPAEELEEESDESSTREIKDGPQAKDYFDDDDDGIRKKKKSKKGKKKKKEIKKKAKKLKKIIPYLLIPILIQMTLLPFVFKKLFFLAMKALFAGKVALILIGFNLLRNTCIKNEDDYSQKIRVEHYGYRKGEEYGAWVNGRSLQEPLVMTALSDEPFRGQKPE